MDNKRELYNIKSIHFICGGVIKESIFRKHFESKKGVYAVLLEWVLPDDEYDKWEQLYRKKKYSEAQELLKKHGKSIIKEVYDE